MTNWIGESTFIVIAQYNTTPHSFGIFLEGVRNLMTGELPKSKYWNELWGVII